MLKEDELIGAIAIYRRGSCVRSPTSRSSWSPDFADQAVIAIENVRLLNELRARTDELARSVEELRALGEVSQAVNSTLDLETVLTTIVAKAVQLSGTEAGAIYVFDEAAAGIPAARHLRHERRVDRADQATITSTSPTPQHRPAAASASRCRLPTCDEEPSSPVNEIILRGRLPRAC